MQKPSAADGASPTQIQSRLLKGPSFADVVIQEVARLAREVQAIQRDRDALLRQMEALRAEVREMKLARSGPPIRVVGRDGVSLERILEQAVPYTIVEIPEGIHSFELLELKKPVLIRRSMASRKSDTVLMGCLSEFGLFVCLARTCIPQVAGKLQDSGNRGSIVIASRGVKIESVCFRCDPESQYTQMITVGTSECFIDATEAELVDCDSNMSLVINSGAPVVRHCSFQVQGELNDQGLRASLNSCIWLGRDTAATIDSCFIDGRSSRVHAFSIDDNAWGRLRRNVVCGTTEYPAFHRGSFGNCDLDQSNEISCPVYHGVRKLRALEQSHPASPAAPGRFGSPDGRTTLRDDGILQHGLSHGAHLAISPADNHRSVPYSGQGQEHHWTSVVNYWHTKYFKKPVAAAYRSCSVPMVRSVTAPVRSLTRIGCWSRWTLLLLPTCLLSSTDGADFAGASWWRSPRKVRSVWAQGSEAPPEYELWVDFRAQRNVKLGELAATSLLQPPKVKEDLLNLAKGLQQKFDSIGVELPKGKLISGVMVDKQFVQEALDAVREMQVPVYTASKEVEGERLEGNAFFVCSAEDGMPIACLAPQQIRLSSQQPHAAEEVWGFAEESMSKAEREQIEAEEMKQYEAGLKDPSKYVMPPRKRMRELLGLPAEKKAVSKGQLLAKTLPPDALLWGRALMQRFKEKGGSVSYNLKVDRERKVA
eukprot:s4069_g7.t2